MTELIPMKKKHIKRCVEIEAESRQESDLQAESKKVAKILKQLRKAVTEAREVYFASFFDHPDRRAYCIQHDGETVGYITIVHMPDKESAFYVYVDEIRVASAYQGKGIGTEAMKLLFEQYDEGQNVSLLTQKKLPAYHMYQKLGFRDAGKRRLMIRGAMADMIMQLEAQAAALKAEKEALEAEYEALEAETAALIAECEEPETDE